MSCRITRSIPSIVKRKQTKKAFIEDQGFLVMIGITLSREKASMTKQMLTETIQIRVTVQTNRNKEKQQQKKKNNKKAKGPH